MSRDRRRAMTWLCKVGRLPAVWRSLTVLLLTAGVFVGAARASVSLLLEQPYGGMATYNPTGHSALFFDHLCAATPVQLRPCGPGELGAVISRYDGIGRFDWIAVPLIPYLYAVDSMDKVPAQIDALNVLRLRDLYRRENLQEVAPDTPTGGMPQGNWYELAGSAYDRTLYGFRVRTSPEQDAMLLAYFNDRRNVSEYNGAFKNCADFARVVLDRLYPHAVRRNLIADFGLTTPKAVARGLTHYAHKHPELDLETFTVPQVKGTLPRSRDVQGVTESLLKRYGVPLLVLSPHATALILVAYVGRGRFALPKHSPVLDLPALERTAEAVRLASLPPADGLRVAQSSTETPFAAPAPILPVLGGSSGQAAYFNSMDCDSCEAVPFLP